MTSFEDIEIEYKKINDEEARVMENLNLLLGQQCQIEAKLRNVSLLFPRLKTVKSDSKHLYEMIQFTSVLAENVSAKVRELDLAKSRVSECQQRVNDLLDLQLCREGVITSMKTEDFETAAALVHRFLAIDETTLKLTAGDDTEGRTVDSSLVLLHEAQNQLCRVIEQKFDESARDRDAASVERFFKIFPLLNMHEEGIKKFSSYLATRLKENSPLLKQQEPTQIRAAVKFADTLTLLVEGVARILEIHQPLVETYYGPGHLLQVVEFLQPECDRQANQILAEFRRTRQLDKQIRQVSEALANSRRSLSSCYVDSICAVINNACTLLEEDYSLEFQQHLKQGFPSGYLDLAQAYNVIQSSLQQGRLQSSDTEKAKTIFLTTLNNIETSIECVETLQTNITNEIQLNFGSTLTLRDQRKLQTCLAGLKTTAAKFRKLSDFGHEQLKSSAIKPRIKPWVDNFLSVNHDIDEDTFSCYEAQDPFVQDLIAHLGEFMNGFQYNLTPNNYQELIATLTVQVAIQFEKAIFKTNFSRLGALQLDKELRALITYLSGATTWTIRDRFTRLTQIVTILNLESLSEISEYWGPNTGSITWRLTPSEVRKILALRTDFRLEDIKRVKL
uniref:Conserved oligomeric Golgi complex subunit 4 n=1 Tax=Evadne anonyx TaxID=141404 RepID=A0A9N6ZF76_9CRUS|nr:EOG090X02VY [Evadne anonyx]